MTDSTPDCQPDDSDDSPLATVHPLNSPKGPSSEALRLRDVLGEVLRSERQLQGRTLEDVAQDAAVSLQYLSEVERGRKDVSSDLLDAVHRALGLELDEVLEQSLHRVRRYQGPQLLAA